MSRLAVIILVSACGFRHGSATTSDVPGGSDAPGPRDSRDAEGDGGCAAWSYAPSNFDPCALPAGAPLAVAPAEVYAIDTATTPLPHAITTQSNGVPVLLVHLTTLDMQGTLTTTGGAVIVLAVDGTASIGASAVVQAGAGADLACTGLAGAPGAASTQSPAGAGGGAGGAGGGDSGNGGDGAGGGHGAGAMHSMHVASTLVPLRGGCYGGAGGSANGAGTPGTGGNGGGGIQISSNTSVTVSGLIDVRGGGGGPTTAETGGGGGGGGGAIFLEGPLVHIQTGGVLCADGGAGSQGGGSTATNGAGATSPCTGLAGATTISSGNSGGNGGSGGYLGGVNGGNAVNGQGGSTAAGGGGGGAAGWIRIHAVPTRTVDPGAVITPADS